MLIIVLICLLKEAFASNVAFGKRARKCGGVEHECLTDGIMESIEISSYCFSDTYISVHLDTPFYVNYVIVYTGELEPKLRGQVGGYYAVSIADGTELDCGSYPNSLIMKDFNEGLRINCANLGRPVSENKLYFPQANVLKLSEIEVHTLGNNKTGEDVMFHVGCFEQFFSLRNIAFKNFRGCRKYCATYNSPVMAIEEKMICHCGLDYNVKYELTLDRCKIICEERYCGGSYTFSVYIVSLQLPYFFGCARTKTARWTIEGNVTIAGCLQSCANHSFIWLTENTCGCESIPLTEIVPLYHCTHICSGDPTEVCGGNEYSSVYSTCMTKPVEFLGCEKLFHCAKGYNKFGVCIGGCKSGFTGDHCIERVSDTIEEIVQVAAKDSKGPVAAGQRSNNLRSNVIFGFVLISIVTLFL